MTFLIESASQRGPLLVLPAVRLSPAGGFRSLTGLLARLTALASISVLLASCGGDGGGSGGTTRSLLSIAVTPDAPSVPKGLTQQFKATGAFSDTSTADLTNSVTWTTSNPVIAAVVSNSGLATTAAVGSTVIAATSGSTSGSTTLTVAPAAVESIVITPNPAFSGIGITRQLTATGTYSDGTTANVNNAANWTSGTLSVATVGPTTGQVTGVSLGSATIYATIGSVTGSVPLAIIANTWSPAASLLAARAGHTATLLPNGKVVVAGGILANGWKTASAELYDPAADTWSSAGGLSGERIAHTATLLPSGKVLVAAGATGGPSHLDNVPTAISDLYDPVANTWSPAALMLTGRFSHTATLLPNGKVLVAGGQTGTYLATIPTASCELYDPVTNTWSPAASLLTASSSHTATLLPNGKVLVLVAGGVSSELYDPVANTWSPAASLLTARGLYTATLLPNGKVLVAGGIDNANLPLASAELYDPVANTWSPAGSLLTAVYDHTATLLPNGKVLVAGGTIATPELYDPVANTWSPAGSLLTAVRGHTATLLSNGAVLVAGGGTPVPTTSSQLYW